MKSGNMVLLVVIIIVYGGAIYFWNKGKSETSVEAQGGDDKGAVILFALGALGVGVILGRSGL